MKRIAAITMARNDEFFLNRWVAYYGPLLGEKNLYIYLDGLDQKAPAGAGRTNVERVEKKDINVYKYEKARLSFLSDRAAELFAAGYDLVIGVDADEFLVVDPKVGKNLAEYLSDLQIKTTVSGLGLDFGQHLKNELPFNPALPFLAQRQYALVSTRFTKASVISRPVRWGWGFHRIKRQNFHIDPNLYLLHFGNTDYEALRKKARDMEIKASGRAWHFKRRRLSVVRDVTHRRAMDFDRATRAARIIQTYLRPPWTWNKPFMMFMHWVVKIPERFAGLV
ncbi:MAG: glycosyltransferase family 2 protein [Rickettsiales bacterium]|jgi:hypothetical protein|nr:glycosyltransferase family 2 protein [Rickettsiales bacterium]